MDSRIRILGDGKSVEVMLDNLTRRFEELGVATERVTNQMNRAVSNSVRKTENEVKKMKKSVLTFKNAMKGGAMIFGVKGAFDFLEKMERINLSIDVLKAKNASLAAVVERTSEITGGLAQKYEMVNAANQALAFGVVKNGKDFERMMKYVVKVSATTGQSVGFLMEKLTSGLARGSIKLLDDLGISIKSTTNVNKRYAKSIGVNVSSLTKQQQMHALTQEALAQLETITAKVSDKIIKKNTGITRSYNLIKEALITTGTIAATVFNKIADASEWVGAKIADVTSATNKMSNEQYEYNIRWAKAIKIVKAEFEARGEVFLRVDSEHLSLVMKKEKQLKKLAEAEKARNKEILEAKNRLKEYNVEAQKRLILDEEIYNVFEEMRKKTELTDDQKWEAKKRRWQKEYDDKIEAQKRYAAKRKSLASAIVKAQIKELKDFNSDEEYLNYIRETKKTELAIRFKDKRSNLQLEEALLLLKGRKKLNDRDLKEQEKMNELALKFVRVGSKQASDFKSVQKYKEYNNDLKHRARLLASDKRYNTKILQQLIELKTAKFAIRDRNRSDEKRELIEYHKALSERANFEIEMLKNRNKVFSDYLKRRSQLVKDADSAGNYKEAQRIEIEDLKKYYEEKGDLILNSEEEIQEGIQRIKERYQKKEYEDARKSLMKEKEWKDFRKKLVIDSAQNMYSEITNRASDAKRVEAKISQDRATLQLKIEENLVNARKRIRDKEKKGLSVSEEEKNKILNEARLENKRLEEEFNTNARYMRENEVASMGVMLQRVAGMALQQAGSKIFADGVQRVWIGTGELISTLGVKGWEDVAYGTAEIAGGLALGYTGQAMMPSKAPAPNTRKENSKIDKNKIDKEKIGRVERDNTVYLYPDERAWLKKLKESQKKLGSKK